MVLTVLLLRFVPVKTATHGTVAEARSIAGRRSVARRSARPDVLLDPLDAEHRTLFAPPAFEAGVASVGRAVP